tara:strand:- start:678 stop:821 length:144 start_codon:yes stop_codon:yes gene_type:complete
MQKHIGKNLPYLKIIAIKSKPRIDEITIISNAQKYQQVKNNYKINAR